MRIDREVIRFGLWVVLFIILVDGAAHLALFPALLILCSHLMEVKEHLARLPRR